MARVVGQDPAGDDLVEGSEPGDPGEGRVDRRDRAVAHRLVEVARDEARRSDRWRSFVSALRPDPRRARRRRGAAPSSGARRRSPARCAGRRPPWRWGPSPRRPIARPSPPGGPPSSASARGRGPPWWQSGSRRRPWTCRPRPRCRPRRCRGSRAGRTCEGASRISRARAALLRLVEVALSCLDWSSAASGPLIVRRTRPPLKTTAVGFSAYVSARRACAAAGCERVRPLEAGISDEAGRAAERPHVASPLPPQREHRLPGRCRGRRGPARAGIRRTLEDRSAWRAAAGAFIEHPAPRRRARPAATDPSHPAGVPEGVVEKDQRTCRRRRGPFHRHRRQASVGRPVGPVGRQGATRRTRAGDGDQVERPFERQRPRSDAPGERSSGSRQASASPRCRRRAAAPRRHESSRWRIQPRLG